MCFYLAIGAELGVDAKCSDTCNKPQTIYEWLGHKTLPPTFLTPSDYMLICTGCYSWHNIKIDFIPVKRRIVC